MARIETCTLAKAHIPLVNSPSTPRTRSSRVWQSAAGWGGEGEIIAALPIFTIRQTARAMRKKPPHSKTWHMAARQHAPTGPPQSKPHMTHALRRPLQPDTSSSAPLDTPPPGQAESHSLTGHARVSHPARQRSSPSLTQISPSGRTLSPTSVRWPTSPPVSQRDEAEPRWPSARRPQPWAPR